MTQNDATQNKYGPDDIALDQQAITPEQRAENVALTWAGETTPAQSLLRRIFEYRDLAEERGARKARGKPDLALTGALNEMEDDIRECLLSLEAESHKVPQVEQCGCEGFQRLVDVKAIHLARGQMVSGGMLSGYAYYWLGPVRQPEEGMFAQFCPCCGKEVALTAKFLAEHAGGED